MKNILLSFIILFGYFINCYSQNWLWAKTTNGGGQTRSVYADKSGNVYVTGAFGDSIIFGSTTLTSSDGSDIFIVKYDVNGNVIWSKSLGGGKSGSEVTADSSGNVFVIASFDSSAITIGSTTLINAGGYNQGSAGNGQGDPCTDMFITKLDVTGNILWAKSAGGTENEYGVSVSTDPNGNVIVMGLFNSPTINFGSITLTNSNSSGYNRDICITKYDTNGNVLWAKSALGDGRSISTDIGGNVFLTGEVGTALITKYDPNGNIVWTKNATGNSAGFSISTDANGNVFVAGGFNGSTIAFDSITLTGKAQGSNLFIVKYDFNGNALWAKTSGGTDNGIGHSVSADPSGGAFVTGSFDATTLSLIFGSITLTPPPVNCSPFCYPMFIVKYDANGNELCASALASGGIYRPGVSVDPYGNAYIAGGFGINPFIIGTDTLPLTGGESFFLAKYNCDFITAKDELNNKKNMAVYPNPSFGIFTINLENKTIENKICVYDILGNCVIEKMSMKNSNEEIDLSKQSKGIYFLEIVAGQERIIEKIVLQ